MQFPKKCDDYPKVIVTRHQQLVDYLITNNIVPVGTVSHSHVSIKDIEDKHVIGILPFHLACHCAVFTEIPLRIPYDKRNRTLTDEEFNFCIQEPRTYVIREVTE